MTTTVRVTDMHTAGEPVRIVEAGFPELSGSTILEKRRDARDRHDRFRRMIMLEPRGHAGMYGVIPTAPCAPDADLAVLFTHVEGYSTMCGHATIALGRWALGVGLVTLTDGVGSFRLEAPCGVIPVTVRQDEKGVDVSFESVASFAHALDQRIVVPGLGEVVYDLAFGGAFYAILPASRIGLDFAQTPVRNLTAAAVAITEAVRESVTIVHPDEPDLGFLYGVILTDDVALGGGKESRNLCIFADGQIDRSPTGSGVTARIALAAERGDMRPGDRCRVSGISGEAFDGILASCERTGDHAISRAVIAGRAYFSGTCEFVAEADDPFGEGFELPQTMDGG